MDAPVANYIFTSHARREMARRLIAENTVRQVLAAPGQRLRVRRGREVVQSRVDFGGRVYLVRVVVDTGHTPAEVVTAYRTSKIAKYWRPDQ